MPERLFSGEGSISIRVLIWILVLSLALYVGFKVVPPTFSHLMMKTEVEEETGNAYMYSNEALTRRLIEKAGIWSILIDRRNIVIKRWSKEIVVEVNYTVTLTFFGAYERKIDYSIEATSPLKDTSHILE